jgi:cell fate (sporulation/competence/biofilm development) regulator YlbF (YheA/YmcA/DUF963 family)
METYLEKAHEAGRLIAQTDDYKALKRADERLSDDREAVELFNQLSTLEEEISGALRSGQEPSQEQQQNYQSLVERLQQRPTYQAMVAAQANFERLMTRVNEEIAKGIQTGERSRIILS